ncbi:hypothetical protein HNQ08_004497 [Deinococcus humi]|uniref:Uncharacterized protein n=1 Tax=Deinococcus humi TaxID=662880 RepID=A0A7W8JY62_9DEIO|nr:hypothetical protein [Deinococcus humi]
MRRQVSCTTLHSTTRPPGGPSGPYPVILSTSDAERDVRQAYTLPASSSFVKSDSLSGFLKQQENGLKYWQTSRTVHERKRSQDGTR